MRPPRFLLICALILAASGLYLWWCYPARVDMASYVPADSLLYVETNDLPRVVSGITQTDAWAALSSRTTFRAKFQSATWLSRIARWTGIGSAEEVILARSQFALVVVALDATDAEPALLIRPAAALVVETHTSERRIRPAIEKRVNELAHQVYPQSTKQSKTLDGITFTEWASPQNGRSIVLAFFNSEAILGNDERAVLACIAVRRGNTKSLVDNKELQVMRARLIDDSVAAFGYISTVGLGKLIGAVAPMYVEGASTNSQAVLGNIAAKVVQSAGWSLRFQNGILEDRYFLALPANLAAALREALAASSIGSQDSIRLLPADTYSCTQYKLRDPGLAWRGLNRALSSHLDIIGAVLVKPMLKEALSPYGIDDPEAFLNAAGPEIVTARLDESESASVLIVHIQDELLLRKLVSQRLGPRASNERVGSYEMMISSKEDLLAASFVDRYLLMGPTQLVKRCLLTKAQGSSLDSLTSFRRAPQPLAAAPPMAVTYSNDVPSATVLYSLISGSSIQSVRDRASGRPEVPYSVTTTTVTSDGVERVTRSSSGFLGALATHFASNLSQQ